VKSKPREYPLFYYQCGGVSDRNWMLVRMAFIPQAKRNEISLEYERLFLASIPGDRKAANTYLYEQAVKYRKDE